VTPYHIPAWIEDSVGKRNIVNMGQIIQKIRALKSS
jgi:hypothetical protein